MGTLTLTDKQQRRVGILMRLNEQIISTKRAAQLLGLTDRQVRRLRMSFAQKAMACAMHGNCGRRPANAIDPLVAHQVRQLAGPDGPYHGFNLCHLRDLLWDHHQIVLGRSTLQRLLDTRPKRPKPLEAPPLRRRRLRESAEGMMVQIDGSPHDWLEGRAASLCLMGGIDDATGKVVHLRLWPTENAAGYLYMFRDIAITYGLPMSFYHDKHTILRSPKKPSIEDQLRGKAPMSHVEGVMDELGIQSIAAHSPQAKGRIERLWQTLQDRLIKEMRLAGISSLQEANDFLPDFIARHNTRFCVPAAQPDPVWVALEPDFDLDYYFSIQESRTVKADHTLSYEGQRLQICPSSRRRSLAGHSVTVRTNPEGHIFVYDGKKRLQTQPVPPSPPKPKAPPLPDIPKMPSIYKPNARQRAFIYAKP